ncbi:MAG: trimethylamine methyltransferase family protein [Chloroflexi bacterium]|nr:trimethylamine methyltransferase family protein [Chloroflexota bacterium]
MFSETPLLQPIKPARHFHVIDEEQIQQLANGTLEILAETGVHCPSEKCLKIYAEHGAQVDFDKQIVRLAPELVKASLATAPRYYTMGARSPAHDIHLDGSGLYCATDGCGVETIDFTTRQRRPSCKEDIAKMARIADYLTSIGFYWPIVSAADHASTSPLHELDASFNNTVKHIQSETVMGEKLGCYAIEMAKVIAQNEETMRKRPPLSLLVCCIAPLAQDKEGMESALIFAEAGLPVGFMSMANVGSTGPATLAGTVVAGDAEIVSALVLIQMAHPGTPVFHSFMPGIMHPRTGAYMATAWEGTLLYPIGVEMAHHWGVPTLAGVFATDGQFPGWQTAGDAESSLMLCALAGAETGAGLGLVESCKLLYPEELILDSDIYHRIRMEAAGIDTSREALALDVIKAVGPRSHYLGQRHTRDHMRRRALSDVANQSNPSGGMRDPIEVAREKAEWILNNHHPQPLEPNQQKELTRILEGADQDACAGGRE